MTSLTKLHIYRFEELGGVLPPSWSSLTRLQYLDLSSNGITGPLPSTWGALTDLTFLQLVGNKLSGTIPQQWSALRDLRRVYVDTNQLSGPLPASLSECTALATLSLAGNPGISGQLPPEWSALTNLAHFSVSESAIEGPLPASWSSLSSLTGLFLTFNPSLNGTIPPEWSLLSSLRMLNLANNALSGSIQQLPNATWGAIRLHNNRFTGPLPVSFLQSTPRLPWRLLFGGNLLTGTLPPQYLNHERVALVRIDHNLLHGTLPDIRASQRPILATLSISENRFFGTLPPSWSKLAPGTLELGGNHFTGPLPLEWTAMNATLHTLNLSSNALSGPLPEQWTTLTAMQMLDLSSNYLSGSLPGFWAAFTTLTSLNLHSNNFSGAYPHSHAVSSPASGGVFTSFFRFFANLLLYCCFVIIRPCSSRPGKCDAAIRVDFDKQFLHW